MQSDGSVAADSLAAGIRSPLRQFMPLAAIHLAALVTMLTTEGYEVPRIAGFLLAWGLLNFCWLVLFRRPAVAAALSFVVVAILIALSLFKIHVAWQSIHFADVMIVDPAAMSFLLTTIPDLGAYVLFGIGALIPLLVVVWRLDPFRLPRLAAAAGAGACLLGLAGLSLAAPFTPDQNWSSHSHVSGFARSGVDLVQEYLRNGYMESDATVTERLRTTAQAQCEASGQHPHIIMLHDESAFDFRAIPGVKLPPGYGGHFRSFDGKQRSVILEAAGGPSWYTEYNVYTGLSARTFGRFSYFITRIAAGRVERGLPHALRHCGYRTFSLYPAYGAFLSARSFQTTVGVQKVYDRGDMRPGKAETDAFYYDQAATLLQRERGSGPMAVFMYLTTNHFPWDFRWRPDLTPEWKDPGNAPDVDEYLRRQTLTARWYREFLERLQRELPGERFLIVRYSDHLPRLAIPLIDRAADDQEIARRLERDDLRYFTSYYAIDAINHRPRNVMTAFDTIEAAYLPLVALESAGLPLDATFVEQKSIFERCRGMFYRCRNGAEARRFNRLLIEAGLIKGL